MLKDAKAGTDNGTMIRVKICKWLAPSIRALQKLFGQADDVIAQQVNGQRQAKGRVSDPKAGKGLGRHLAAVRQFTIGQPLV